MKLRRLLVVASCAPLLLAAESRAAQAPARLPLTHEALWMMKRVGTPVVSPDGRLVVFSVTEPSYDEKKESADLWIAPATDDDWMTLLLQSRAFHKIPPANLQAAFMRMQRMNYSAGDTVIRQGGEGDFFYAIVDGRCVVTRETPLNREGVKLAELGKGDTFGEEALISGAKRNATVSMLTDGVVMRLGKDDFNTLLNEPMLQWVDVEEAQALIGRGARWLDVRLPSEYEHVHFDDALNLPLYFVRIKLKTLDTDVSYVVCCDTGRRSSAAAYILSERGYDSYVLRGGIAATDLAEALIGTSGGAK